MFGRSFLLYTVLATLYSTALASPALSARSSSIRTLADATAQFPQLLPLEEGNARFQQSIAESDNPDLLWSLTANGQHPDYLFIGCR